MTPLLENTALNVSCLHILAFPCRLNFYTAWPMKPPMRDMEIKIKEFSFLSSIPLTHLNSRPTRPFLLTGYRWTKWGKTGLCWHILENPLWTCPEEILASHRNTPSKLIQRWFAFLKWKTLYRRESVSDSKDSNGAVDWRRRQNSLKWISVEWF